MIASPSNFKAFLLAILATNTSVVVTVLVYHHAHVMMMPTGNTVKKRTRIWIDPVYENKTRSIFKMGTIHAMCSRICNEIKVPSKNKKPFHHKLLESDLGKTFRHPTEKKTVRDKL